MLFRREFSVKDLPLYKLPSEGAEIILGGSHQIRVRLRHPTRQEVGGGHAKDSVFCAAEGSWEPNRKVAEALGDLAALRVPSGNHIPDDPRGKWYLTEEGGLRADRPLPLDFLPDSAQTFVGQVSNELADAIRRTVKVLRWRWGLSGPHNPFAVRVDQEGFSLDGKTWHPLPNAGYVDIFSAMSFELTAKRRENLAELLSTGVEEPLGHELLREAMTLRRQAPRSALLIGVSALEVGFKELVAELAPAAEWLVENAPSPPVVRMLEEYLPKLPVRASFQGKVLAPPKMIIDQLKKAVQARNKVTHAGGSALRGDSLDEALMCIEDTLWLLDYYAGREWALRHLRTEALVALGVLKTVSAYPN